MENRDQVARARPEEKLRERDPFRAGVPALNDLVSINVEHDEAVRTGLGNDITGRRRRSSIVSANAAAPALDKWATQRPEVSGLRTSAATSAAIRWRRRVFTDASLFLGVVVSAAAESGDGVLINMRVDHTGRVQARGKTFAGRQHVLEEFIIRLFLGLAAGAVADVMLFAGFIKRRAWEQQTVRIIGHRSVT